MEVELIEVVHIIDCGGNFFGTERRCSTGSQNADPVAVVFHGHARLKRKGIFWHNVSDKMTVFLNARHGNGGFHGADKGPHDDHTDERKDKDQDHPIGRAVCADVLIQTG